jgi:hypothetical protein
VMTKTAAHIAAAGSSGIAVKATASAAGIALWIKVAAVIAIITGVSIGVMLYPESSGSNAPTVAVKPVTPARASNNAISPLKFTDGTLVELLALQDPRRPSVWWAPDGTPTTDPKFPNGGTFTMTYSAAHRIDAIVRINATGARQKTVTLRSDQPYRTAMRQTGNGSQRLAHIIMPVARGATSGDVGVGLAGGAWDDRCYWDVADGEASAPSVEIPTLELQSITENEGRTQVTIISPEMESQSSDVQLVVIANGNEVRSGMGVSLGSRYTFTFKCPVDQVSRIIARSRPFEWIELKNVAFEPTKTPTDVQIAAPTSLTGTAP